MPIDPIDIGASPGDPTGDSLRDAFDKVNSNDSALDGFDSALGNAASRDVGTGAGDVAAGNHGHTAAQSSYTDNGQATVDGALDALFSNYDAMLATMVTVGTDLALQKGGTTESLATSIDTPYYKTGFYTVPSGALGTFPKDNGVTVPNAKPGFLLHMTSGGTVFQVLGAYNATNRRGTNGRAWFRFHNGLTWSAWADIWDSQAVDMTGLGMKVSIAAKDISDFNTIPEVTGFYRSNANPSNTPDGSTNYRWHVWVSCVETGAGSAPNTMVIAVKASSSATAPKMYMRTKQYGSSWSAWAAVGSGIRYRRNREVFTASGTWNKPAGMVGDTVWITGCGGGKGGQGGGSYPNTTYNGNGGDGGAAAPTVHDYPLPLRPGDTSLTVVIGAGGTGGPGASAGVSIGASNYPTNAGNTEIVGYLLLPGESSADSWFSIANWVGGSIIRPETTTPADGLHYGLLFVGAGNGGDGGSGNNAVEANAVGEDGGGVRLNYLTHSTETNTLICPQSSGGAHGVLYSSRWPGGGAGGGGNLFGPGGAGGAGAASTGSDGLAGADGATPGAGGGGGGGATYYRAGGAGGDGGDGILIIEWLEEIDE